MRRESWVLGLGGMSEEGCWGRGRGLAVREGGVGCSQMVSKILEFTPSLEDYQFLIAIHYKQLLLNSNDRKQKSTIKTDKKSRTSRSQNSSQEPNRFLLNKTCRIPILLFDSQKNTRLQ